MPSLGRIILDPSKFFTFSHPSCERNPTELRHQHLQPFPQVWLATGHLLLSNQTGLALGECEGGWMKTKRSVKAFCLPGKGSSRGGRADVWDGWLLVGLEPHWWTSGWKVGDVFFVFKNTLSIIQACDRCDECLPHNVDGHWKSPVESRAEGFLSAPFRNPPPQDTGGSRL